VIYMYLHVIYMDVSICITYVNICHIYVYIYLHPCISHVDTYISH
jgi:hypothetical protein